MRFIDTETAELIISDQVEIEVKEVRAILAESLVALPAFSPAPH